MRNPNKNDLTSEYVRKLFDYDKDAGYLISKGYYFNNLGKRIGYVNSGYRSVKVNGKSYLEHRIIWLHVTGEWPENEIDHINLNKTDNRWENLREATRRQNTYNGPKRTTRKYGSMKGAYYHKRFKKWQCQFMLNGKNTSLGWFDTELEAHNAYLKKANELYKDFARAN